MGGGLSVWCWIKVLHCGWGLDLGDRSGCLVEGLWFLFLVMWIGGWWYRGLMVVEKQRES